jgi:hypothetical protein
LHYRRNKNLLALMEQSVMICVFSLAVAVCLQAYVYANQISKLSEKREFCSAKAWTIAEYCKAEKGDRTAVCRKVHGTKTSNGLVVSYPSENMQIILKLTEKKKNLQKATLEAVSQGRQIYVMETAWQMVE